MSKIISDFLIIGGGVIGLTVAIELKKRHKNLTVTILEKEFAVGLHASGRNSGVLHAGFYYSADSLKAKFTKEGNQALTEYCEEREIPINKCGKLVVVKNDTEIPGALELLSRAEKNGVELHKITEKEAKNIEPRVKTYEMALWSPSTSTVDPNQVMRSLVRDAEDLGIRILRNNSFNKSEVSAGYIVNTAGLYADKIAKEFGFSQNYTILPFKGLYLYGNNQESLSTNIYPVPNLKNPFLGVHFTKTIHNDIKIGPTAIPCLWREQYKMFDNFNFPEFYEGIKTMFPLLFSNNFNLIGLASEEMKKYWRSYLVNQAGELVKDVSKDSFTKWGKSGIRAQLVNIKEKSLVMDFCIEHDKKSLHVLNAVSPAFTCSISFSKYICDIIDQY